MVSREPRRTRALVVDDEPALRDLVCEMLRFLGFDADGAANGPEGLAFFEQGGYELVVTDLMMPGMTGWEVVEAVRRRAPAVPVIMATASGTNLDLDRARELNLMVLAKPFQLDELKRAVEQTLKAGAGVSTPAQLLGRLRAALGTVRKAATDLEGALGAVETLAGEHEALRQEHEATARALGDARAQCQALIEERRGAVEGLETIARRLRG